MKKISNRIYNERIKLNLTMEELANKVGVTKSTISKWEKGHIDDIKASHISALAKALYVSPLWLLGDDKVTKIEDIELIISKYEIDELKRLSAFIDYQMIVKQKQSQT